MRTLLLAFLFATANVPDPATPADWFNLGVTRHDSGDFAGAVKAFMGTVV